MPSAAGFRTEPSYSEIWSANHLPTECFSKLYIEHMYSYLFTSPMFGKNVCTVSIDINIAQVRGASNYIFFLFITENICCGYYLEVPQ